MSRSLNSSASPKPPPPSKGLRSISQKRKSSTQATNGHKIHPLLKKMGLTEIPEALQKMGVTAETLDQMEADDLRGIVRRVQTLSRKLRYEGPSNDEELYAWVKTNIGVDIPRIPVCEDHVAPFKLLADLYFERTSAALALANRGGAKTFLIAILHFLNSTYKAGCESLSFGATEAQGNRCYNNIEDWCYERDSETGRRTDIVLPFIRERPKKSQTVWKTGSVVEVVAGSENAVSGPHPAKAHADEIDMMEEAVWNQSRGMAVTNRAKGPLPKWMERFNGMIPPQDIATSTRNSTKGRMQELLDENEQDVKNGDIPQFDVYPWCIWETVQEVSNCRCIGARERKKRLRELGMDPESLCECNRVVKGRLPGGAKRTLETSCEGKAFRARGWKPYIDLVRTFKRNTPGTWTLQHECRHGQDENNYIQGWSLAQYGLRHYEPHPLYGPIYMGVDWGSTHPACVLWFQYLTAEVPGLGFEYEPIWLSAGVYVCFREVYVVGLGSDALAKRVVGIENEYRNEYGHAWKVKGRFCDPQGAGDRIIFKNHGLPSSWPIKTRQKDRMIDTVQNLVVDDRFAVDVDQCPMFCEEVEGWQRNPKTGKELDKFNHAMAAWRYGVSNAEVFEGKRRAMMDKRTNSRNQPGGDRARQIVTPRRRGPFDPDSNEVVYGSVASRGGTELELDPRFALNYGRD